MTHVCSGVHIAGRTVNRNEKIDDRVLTIEDTYFPVNIAGLFVPGNKGVSPWGHIADPVLSVPIRLCEPLVWGHNHRSRHIGVQSAVHENYTGIGEQYGPHVALRIISQVEALCFGEREHIMKDGIHIGKDRRTAHGDYNDVGVETPIDLRHVRGLRGCGIRADMVTLHPNDDSRSFVSERITHGILPSSTTGPRSYTDTEAVTLGRVRRCLTVMVPLMSAPDRHAAIESVAAAASHRPDIAVRRPDKMRYDIAAVAREAEYCIIRLIGRDGASSTAKPEISSAKSLADSENKLPGRTVDKPAKGGYTAGHSPCI